jgi:MFS family permease
MPDFDHHHQHHHSFTTSQFAPTPSILITDDEGEKISKPIITETLNVKSLSSKHTLLSGLRVFSPIVTKTPETEPIVLCEDVIERMTLFMQPKQVLSFRRLNSTCDKIVKDHSDYWKFHGKLRFDSSVTTMQQFLEQSQIHYKKRVKLTRNLTAVRTIHPAQKMMRLLYGAVCPFLFSLGLVLMAVLWPLLQDETIPSDTATLGYTLLAVGSLTVIPYLVMAIGITLDAFVIYPVKITAINRGLPSGKQPTDRFLENHELRDYRSRHSLVIFIWGLMGVPIVIVSYYLRYIVGQKTYHTFYCIPQYVFTAVYIIVPLLNHLVLLLKVKDHPLANGNNMMKKILGLPLFVHANAIFFNFMLCCQVAIISARLDGAFGGSWLYMFLPTWTYFIVFSIVTCCFSIILWTRRGETPSITSFITFICMIVWLFVMLFISTGAVVIALKLDQIFLIYYFIVSIPVFFGLMLLLPISCVSSVVCCYYTCSRKLDVV